MLRLALTATTATTLCRYFSKSLWSCLINLIEMFIASTIKRCRCRHRPYHRQAAVRCNKTKAGILSEVQIRF